MTMTSEEARRQVWIDSALDLAEEVWSARVRARGGDVTWLVADGERGPVRPLGPYLYDGTIGIALVFAMLAHVDAVPDREVWRQRSLDVAEPVRRRILDLTSTPSRFERLSGLGLGGHVGLGSLIWSFHQMGRMLEDPSLCEQARTLARLVSVFKVEQDRTLDVLSGSAGAILSLLALYEDGWDEALERAEVCAHHLLASRVEVDGLRAWKTLPQFPPLVGFTHGASGIAYALLRLYAHLDLEEFKVAAFEGLEFERRAYSTELGTWRDLRSTGEHVSTSTWCYGAPGITLARLQCLAATEDADLRKDYESALRATRNMPLLPRGDLCCGGAGHVAVLLAVAQQARHTDLWYEALDQLGVLQKRCNESANSIWLYSPADGRHYSLFSGLAGIVYALLVAATNNSLPSPLLLNAWAETQRA